MQSQADVFKDKQHNKKQLILLPLELPVGFSLTGLNVCSRSRRVRGFNGETLATAEAGFSLVELSYRHRVSVSEWVSSFLTAHQITE